MLEKQTFLIEERSRFYCDAVSAMLPYTAIINPNDLEKFIRIILVNEHQNGVACVKNLHKAMFDGEVIQGNMSADEFYAVTTFFISKLIEKTLTLERDLFMANLNFYLHIILRLCEFRGEMDKNLLLELFLTIYIKAQTPKNYTTEWINEKVRTLVADVIKYHSTDEVYRQMMERAQKIITDSSSLWNTLTSYYS